MMGGYRVHIEIERPQTDNKNYLTNKSVKFWHVAVELQSYKLLKIRRTHIVCRQIQSRRNDNESASKKSRFTSQ